MSSPKKIIASIGVVIAGATAAAAIENEIDNSRHPNGSRGHHEGFYERHVKRPQDFACALMATIVLSPVMAVTGALVRTRLGSPVIFTQKRPGLHGNVFEIYKFRTMTDARDESGELLSDEERLTPFGKALRSTSLDELPELINILRGDMAVVGPRPLLIKYLPYYTEEESQRHDVRPGLTGLAQVSGRNYLGWDERLGLDVEYVRNISFLNDARIVLDTAAAVFAKKDIAESVEELAFDDLDQERGPLDA